MRFSTHSAKNTYRAGFTLLEISIVLVILGVIVGGVLVGKNLIESAEIRSTLAQLNEIRTAARAFEDKYGGLPGDLSSREAKDNGLYHVTGVSANKKGYGNQDNVLQGYNTKEYYQGATFEGEIAMFYLHLSQALMLKGMYGLSDDAYIVGATMDGGSTTSLPKLSASTQPGAVGQIIPEAKIGGNYIAVGSLYSKNYLIITGVTTITNTGTVRSVNNLTPEQAFSIDSKVDDGLPKLGLVVALDPTGPYKISSHYGLGLLTLSSNACVNGDEYGRKETDLLCSLRIKF